MSQAPERNPNIIPVSLLDEMAVNTLAIDPSSAPGDLCFPRKNIFAERRRKNWDKSTASRCDFTYQPRLSHRAGVWFLSLWQKSIKGRTLDDIKNDPKEITHFAVEIAKFITQLLGDSLSDADWAIVTTPKRRHKVNNFASLISSEIHALTQVPFIEDVAICRSKTRVNAVFDLNILPEQKNLIVFDDFVTTGSTLKSMDSLLRPYGKNLLYVAGINNKL